MLPGRARSVAGSVVEVHIDMTMATQKVGERLWEPLCERTFLYVSILYCMICIDFHFFFFIFFFVGIEVKS